MHTQSPCCQKICRNFEWCSKCLHRSRCRLVYVLWHSCSSCSHDVCSLYDVMGTRHSQLHSGEIPCPPKESCAAATESGKLSCPRKRSPLHSISSLQAIRQILHQPITSHQRVGPKAEASFMSGGRCQLVFIYV